MKTTASFHNPFRPLPVLFPGVAGCLLISPVLPPAPGRNTKSPHRFCAPNPLHPQVKDKGKSWSRWYVLHALRDLGVAQGEEGFRASDSTWASHLSGTWACHCWSLSRQRCWSDRQAHGKSPSLLHDDFFLCWETYLAMFKRMLVAF